MIPIGFPSDMYNPTYTIFYKDMLNIVGDDIKNILADFDNNQKLYDMIAARWGTYECVVGDVNLFVSIVKEIYDENKEYYKELLVNYQKEYDYATGNKRRFERHDNSATKKSGWSYDDNSSSDSHYDLPNKSVNDPEGYMTSKDKNVEVLDGKTGEDNTNNYDSTTVTTYDNEFLELKRAYLSQIRNIYHEFAEKFSECFMKVYN